jgi:NAD(P)-dependent dehydrogenase (short-subunit alcohol dehydrogenase family)
MASNAIITGGASGIGCATARLFVARGWRVGLVDRDAPGLGTLARELGDAAETYCCDVTDSAALSAAIKSFVTHGDGGLDLLVNNAGLLRVGPFEDMPAAQHRELIDVNARGVVEALLVAFPMLRRARGRVVNLASASAAYGTPDFATYSATKMFVRGLSEALDIEWRRHGIRVSCVLPAFVATPMIDGLRTGSLDRLGVQLGSDDVAEVIWRAAHGRRLMWHVGWRYRALRAAFEFLPLAFRRALMQRVSGYPGGPP